MNDIEYDPPGPSGDLKHQSVRPSRSATLTSRSTRDAAPAPSATKVRTPSPQARTRLSPSNSRCIPAWTVHDMTLHVPGTHAAGTTETVDVTVTGDFHN